MVTREELDRMAEPIDWEMEALRQDRERGKLATKIRSIAAIIRLHKDCPSHIGCDGLLEIQAVIDGE